ncbi:rib72 protein-like protein [Novymonas esmeraldas]|uniref:Rib72 protein-like protein n=1 Tax=Novymonas esmeraldas TaxID=1808958 RepID=A0AAW0F8U2_9TRYP
MSVRDKTIYNALPKLPGFSFAELHHPATHGRRQYCTIDDEGTRTVKDAAALDGSAVVAAGAPDGCGIPVRVILQRFPAWRTVDDKVLRFFAYYTETVVASSIESWRVRKVKVHYYLADGSLSIVETPAVANSGLQKGTTVSRFRPEGVDVFRMCIGASIPCRGLEYQLVDCDAFTREFFEVMGMPQPEPLDYPRDEFETSMMRRSGGIDEQHIEMRRVIEVQAATRAGTHASLLTPAERTKARDFYEYDRNVLRFYAVWEKRKFRIYFYLADGSIAVLFDKAENDGRDPYPIFVRRRRIPKEARAVLLSPETLNRPQGPAPACIAAEDLRTGASVDIFTRTFFIYDCDEHTRAYMAARGVAQPPVPAPPCEEDELTVGKRRPRLAKAAREAAAAAAAGGTSRRFGASTMIFGDTVAEKDALKLTRYAQDVFRFGAELVQPSPENTRRQFMICYYLADDTVSVYELQVHNSGHVGGKIFARRAVETVKDPAVLAVGNTVRLDGVDYLLTEMDERTKRYLAMGMPNMEEAYFRTLEILGKVASHLHQQFSRVTDAFRHYASSATQGLTRENVNEVLSDAGVHATETELDAVMERIDGDKDGWVSLTDFTEQLMQQQFLSTFKPRDAQKTWGDTRGGVSVQRGPVQSAMMLARKADAVAQAEVALQRFLTLIEARRTLAIRSFRSTAQSAYDSNLGMFEFQDCVKGRLNVPMTDDEIGALLYKFYYAPGVNDWTARRLPLQEIQRVLFL